MTSNFQLEEYARQLNIPNFKVIMNDDMLSEPKVSNAYYIVNLMDNGTPGSHWVALIIKNDVPIYWDSYGCPYSIQVHEFVSQYKVKCGFNTAIIQDLYSTHCGLYCLALIAYIHANPNKNLYQLVNDYTNSFSSKPKSNDKIILNYIKQLKIKNI